MTLSYLTNSWMSEHPDQIPKQTTQQTLPHTQSQPRHPTLSNSIRKRNRLRALKSIARLQSLKPRDAPRLNTQHVLVPVLWREIRQPVGLFGPGVPHHHVGEIIAEDGERRLAALDDSDGDLAGRADGGVHAVCLARDGEFGGGLGFGGGGRRDFVGVGC